MARGTMVRRSASRLVRRWLICFLCNNNFRDRVGSGSFKLPAGA